MSYDLPGINYDLRLRALDSRAGLTCSIKEVELISPCERGIGSP
jgi:hypothetical protein